jgi:asparaginyl-tRNA synthetase
VKSIRKQKRTTFMHISDGGVEQIQVVIPSSACDEDCCFNSAVEISGKVVVSPKCNQPVEIQGEKIKVVGKLDLQSFPFGPRKYYPPEYVRQQIHLRPKTNTYSAILRLSSLISNALQTTLIQDNFVSVFTPILTSNDCEGAGEVFLIRPSSNEMCREMGGNRKPEESYFNKKVYLTVSGQLHLEAIAGYTNPF